MTDAEDAMRAHYYREMYRVASAQDDPNATPHRISPQAYTAAKQYFDRTMQQLARDPRVRPYRAETPAQQQRYVMQQYGTTRPQGIGVFQGEYAFLAPTENNGSNQFIATDYLVDCHALVLVARDAQGQVQQSLLAHIDAKTEIEGTLDALLAHMPAGTHIDATVLGSPNSYNYYLQADIMKAVAARPQVTRIRYDFDAATTVAVDISTGHILTASGPYVPVSEAYNIRNLPVDITFREYGNETGLSQNKLTENFFRVIRTQPAFGLWQSYDTLRGLRTEDEAASFVLERQRNDGALSGEELREIAAHIGALLHTPVRLDFQPADGGLTKVDIRTQSGVYLDSFYSQRLDTTLGSSGIIDPTNTPPAPGRALATNTMSPPSGRAPTGRQ